MQVSQMTLGLLVQDFLQTYRPEAYLLSHPRVLKCWRQNAIVVNVQKSRRNSLLKRKKKSGANMKLKTLGIKVVDDTFKVSNDTLRSVCSNCLWSVSSTFQCIIASCVFSRDQWIVLLHLWCGYCERWLNQVLYFCIFWLYSSCILCFYLHIFSCFLVWLLLPVHMESFQLSALQIYISWKLMNLISLLFLADSAKSSRICYGFAVIFFCLLGFCWRPLLDSPKDLSCNFSLPNSRSFLLFDAKSPSLA